MDRAIEESLIERAALGDRAASEALINGHRASLVAYLLRLSGRPDVAEDIAHDAFVRVLTNLDRFDPRFRFSTWLFTIAKRLYVNAMQKHRPVYDSDMVGSWTGGSEPEQDATVRAEDRGAAQACLAEALEGLSDEQRQIILLFHQQEWSIAQISSYMNMPEGTIKSHLHRGRRKMRKIFEEVEGAPQDRAATFAAVRASAEGQG